jgi:hypothetical protein
VIRAECTFGRPVVISQYDDQVRRADARSSAAAAKPIPPETPACAERGGLMERGRIGLVTHGLVRSYGAMRMISPSAVVTQSAP